MPNNNFQPEGYNLGRDVQLNTITAGGGGGGFLSEPVRNFSIQQAGNVFTFNRWLSSQSNYNIFPYAIDATAAGQRQTRISAPAFVLDAGEFFDVGGLDYLYTWIYLNSTATATNDEMLFYKTNCTGYGSLDKANLDPNYIFTKTNIDQAVEIGDFVYMSLNDDVAGEFFVFNMLSRWSFWYGSFFRVIDNTIPNQITLNIDNSIFPILYPSSNPNNFIKEYPNAFPGFIGYPAMIYDLGYCFHRPTQTDFQRPIAITINELTYPITNEFNGIITSYDNFNRLGVSVDTLTGVPNITDIMISLNLPICRTAQFQIDAIWNNIADQQGFKIAPLGVQDVTVLPIYGLSNLTYHSGASMVNVVTSPTRGIPIFSLLQIAGALPNPELNSIGIAPISADYLLGRV